MDLDTTIVALSSSSGRASRSLIRASGTSAFDGARKLGLHPQPRQLCKGTLIVEGGSLPVLVCAFPQGSSYTGQDTIEIQLPNNQFLVNTVIGLLVDATDGRLAEAGEFTARAFFLGRLSLTEAEGVSATISANNEAELLGASLLRHGALASIVDPLAKDVASTLARVEAGIDFTDEEDVVVITDKQLKVTIEGCIDIIHSTLEGRIPMAALRHLPHVVIAGIPNAGKSTLFNALLGSRRVVVSSLAGTTRDAIAEPVKFGNKEAMLIDVAGLENTTDQLSAFAQESAQNTIETADLIVWCIAPNHSVPPPLSNTIVIHTMGDLEGADTSALCARTGRGLDELRKQIEQKLSSIPQPHRDALAILPRHEQNLIRALHCLTEALHNRATPELTATSLRLALDALGTITGQITPDEVLGQVFSTFCIGK